MRPARLGSSPFMIVCIMMGGCKKGLEGMKYDLMSRLWVLVDTLRNIGNDANVEMWGNTGLVDSKAIQENLKRL